MGLSHHRVPITFRVAGTGVLGDGDSLRHPERRIERAQERSQRAQARAKLAQHRSRAMTECRVRNRGRRTRRPERNKERPCFLPRTHRKTLTQPSLQGAWTGRVGLGRSQAFSYQRDSGTSGQSPAADAHDVPALDVTTHEHMVPCPAQKAPSPSLGHHSAPLNTHKKVATGTSVRAAGAHHTRHQKVSLISCKSEFISVMGPGKERTKGEGDHYERGR
ncbi:hypothetical protein BC826DRAFT_116086 [Russula brevipes]|nr:hypothetical protein BC826DRAFT_116086 [Russula brevipes]